MRLDPYAREFGAFTDELAGALGDETTRLYLDTSLLTWLARIGRDARQEFIAWCRARPAGTVRVPVWSAHELHRHLVRRSILTNVDALVSDTEKKVMEFAAVANERADDAVCQDQGYADRGAFIAAMEQTVARLKGFATIVRGDRHFSEAADEVVRFVNDHLLGTDLDPIMTRLSVVGDLRFSHLVPPGYLDRKDENRFGDVVIWEEMLADLPGKAADGSPLTTPTAILLSRDDKTDWVSSAPMLRTGDTPGSDKKSNRTVGFDVTRPHPLLVHEFAIRSRGSRLYIVHPGVFAAVLDYGARKQRVTGRVDNLLAAAYRPEFLNRLAVTELAGDGAPAPARVPSGREAPVFAPPSLVEIMAAATGEPLRAYLDATPHDQNIMAQAWATRLVAGTMSPLLYGRLVAELAERGRGEWRAAALATLERLGPTLADAQHNMIVLSILCTAYFDRYGEPRRRPSGPLGEIALALEADARLKPAFERLGVLLAEQEVELPYVPGSGARSIAYQLDLAADGQRRLVRDIRIGAQSVLAEPVGDNAGRRLTAMLGKGPADGPTGRDLRALVARTFLLPFDRLDARHDKQKITWLPDAGLVLLDTGSPGGLSATTDDGEFGE